jgi:hypothetical protein
LAPWYMDRRIGRMERMLLQRRIPVVLINKWRHDEVLQVSQSFPSVVNSMAKPDVSIFVATLANELLQASNRQIRFQAYS